jgi:putative oxidoreductase
MTEESKLRDLGFLILRISVASMLATFHGWAKFSGAIAHIFRGQEWGFPQFVGSIGFPFPTFFALCAALAEFGGCILIALGLFTRYGAGLVAITMSVAVFFHLRTDFGFELAALYLVSSLFLVLAGPGNFSLDHWLSTRAQKKSVSQRAPVSEGLQAGHSKVRKYV